MLETAGILYAAAAFVLLGIRYRRSPQEWWMRFALALAFPIVCFLIPAFWPRRWHEGNARRQREEGNHLFDGLHFQNTEMNAVYRKLDAEKEVNVIPLEEALIVSDLHTRRRAVIDMLKQESLDDLEVLQLAVENEDSETSHYAVSAIVEVKRKLTMSLQDMAVRYEENRGDPHLLQSYAEVLKAYMRSGFLDPRTMMKYKYTYSGVLEQCLQHIPDWTEAYEEKVQTDLELHEYAKAEQTAKRYVERFPRSEEPYLCLMKVYFTMRSYDSMKQVLEQMLKSQVRMSNRALNVVRFWSEGG